MLNFTYFHDLWFLVISSDVKFYLFLLILMIWIKNSCRRKMIVWMYAKTDDLREKMPQGGAVYTTHIC